MSPIHNSDVDKNSGVLTDCSGTKRIYNLCARIAGLPDFDIDCYVRRPEITVNIG
jgi:hypothetical protein